MNTLKAMEKHGAGVEHGKSYGNQCDMIQKIGGIKNEKEIV